MSEYKFWDLGEVDPVRPSQKALAAILMAIVQCRGKIHDAHSLELNSSGEWRYPNAVARSCSVLFRISLPVGMETKFEVLSGYRISPAPKVGVA